MKQENMGYQWHQMDHMQIICTSLQTSDVKTGFFSITGCRLAKTGFLPVTERRRYLMTR